MNPPFTVEQFLDVFRQYNQAIWPLQLAAYPMAAAALAAAVWRGRGAQKLPPLVLSGFWIWTGAAYHIAYFSSINPAAIAFGVLFIVQGLLFIGSGVIRSQLTVRFRPGLPGCVGALLIVYALVLYPLLSYVLGHRFPSAPTFGVTPCPTVIFTFGLLLWSDLKLPRYLLVIPSLWALLGISAALQFGMHEDIGLLVATVLTDLLILLRLQPVRKPRFAGP
jgi:hypothetical protein